MTTIPAETFNIILEDTTLEQVLFQRAWTVLADKAKARQILKDYLEAVFNANPGLASLGVVLPLGTPIELPDFVIEEDQPVIRLWDVT